MARMKDLAFEKASRGAAGKALDAARSAAPIGAALATLALALGLALWMGMHGAPSGSELSALDATSELMAAGGA